MVKIRGNATYGVIKGLQQFHIMHKKGVPTTLTLKTFHNFHMKKGNCTNGVWGLSFEINNFHSKRIWATHRSGFEAVKSCLAVGIGRRPTFHLDYLNP